MKNSNGEVEDLIEKLKKKEITSKEIIKTLNERNLSEKAIFKGAGWGYLIWIVLCFLPALAKYTNWEYISFLNKIPSFEIPNILIYISIAFFISAIILTAWSTYYNIKKGGVSSEDYTLILFKSGPYKLLRHPSHFAWSVFFTTIPIMLGKWVPFTVLSIIGIIAMISLHYFGSIIEERRLNIKKWGDRYKQYMKEVPRWNIILGLVRLGRINSHT